MKMTFYQSGASRRILLVSSDLLLRERNVSALIEAGYCAEGECDAEMAWVALHRMGYELLIVDYQLSGRSGLRLTLRMSHANLTLPVVLVTEAPLAFDPRAHGRLGSITVLPRPFGVERLLEVVLVTLQNGPSPKPVQRPQPAIEAGNPASHRQGRGARQRSPASRPARGVRQTQMTGAWPPRSVSANG